MAFTLSQRLWNKAGEAERSQRVLPTRLPLEIDGRLLTAATTSVWAALLSSAHTHQHMVRLTKRRPGRLTPHRSLRCSNNPIPIILSKQKRINNAAWDFGAFSTRLVELLTLSISIWSLSKSVRCWCLVIFQTNWLKWQNPRFLPMSNARVIE